jgi:hypothetical protein
MIGGSGDDFADSRPGTLPRKSPRMPGVRAGARHDASGRPRNLLCLRPSPCGCGGARSTDSASRRAFSERRCLSAPARRCSRSSRGIRIAAPLPGPVNVTAASKAGTTRAPGARTHERGAEVVDHAAQRREYVPEPLDRSEEASVACLHGHLQPVRRAGLGQRERSPRISAQNHCDREATGRRFSGRQPV